MPKKDKPSFSFDGFPGFSVPELTQVPDIFFDSIMTHLSEAELRVMLYILRHTYGYKKSTDQISLSQITDGITTHEGKVVDLGAGVQKAAAVRAIKGLVEKGLIIAQRNTDPIRGYLATTYWLRMRQDVPLSTKETRGVIPKIQGLVSEGNRQDPTLQGYDPGITWSAVLTSLRPQIPKSLASSLETTTGDHWEGLTLVVLCEHQTQANHLSGQLGSRVDLVLGKIVEGASARFIATARLFR